MSDTSIAWMLGLGIGMLIGFAFGLVSMFMAIWQEYKNASPAFKTRMIEKLRRELREDSRHEATTA